MSDTVICPTISVRVATLQAELAAVNTAILSALAQPDSVSISGGVSYTNRKLADLYAIRDRINRELQSIANGGGMVATTPRYY